MSTVYGFARKSGYLSDRLGKPAASLFAQVKFLKSAVKLNNASPSMVLYQPIIITASNPGISL
jgi:hypothetical protein